MKSTTLKTKQPKVFKLLENALKKNRLAHVYLFVGNNHELMTQCSYLFLSSIIEGKNEFVTDSNLLHRVSEHSFADFRYLDNAETSIKVNNIRELIEDFQKTPIESYGKKVYLLNNFDNVSNLVANALLKFIEEPTKDTYGIIIINNKDNVLDTIKSRCQTINFEESRFSDLYERFKPEVEDPHSYLLSRLKMEDGDFLESERYQIAYQMMIAFINNIFQIDNFMFYLHDEIFINKSDTKLMKECFKLFLQMAIIVLNDSLVDGVNAGAKYLELVNKVKIEQIEVVSFIEILLDSMKEFESISFDYRLVADKMCYLLKGV